MQITVQIKLKPEAKQSQLIDDTLKTYIGVVNSETPQVVNVLYLNR